MGPCDLIKYENGKKLSKNEYMRCVAHITSKDQNCKMCCRNQNCGTRMPKCQVEDDGPCMWGNWGSWSKCSTKCKPGIQSSKRLRKRDYSKRNTSGESCEGEEVKQKDCDGSLSKAQRQELKTKGNGIYEIICEQ